MESDAKFLILLNSGRILIQDDGNGRHTLPSPADISLTADPEKEGRFRFSQPVEAEALSVDPDTICGTDSRQRWVPLRESAILIPECQYSAAAKASELIHWDSTSRYCSVCGAKMERTTEISKSCTSCHREIWPAISPAIIVLVLRDDKALLVHAKTFSGPFYGLVAGFVETGESLEECVRREVREETSLEITDIRYFGSQSWPFPSQLMLGFTARYESGDIRFADGELTSGGFFSRGDLPLIPSPPSIARRMIDAWISHSI